jgi:hypothetical protein
VVPLPVGLSLDLHQLCEVKEMQVLLVFWEARTRMMQVQGSKAAERLILLHLCSILVVVCM